MCDNTSDVVHPYLFDPDSEPFPQIAASAQCFQNLYPLSACFYDTGHRLVLDPSDSRTSIEAIPDDNRIQSFGGTLLAQAMGQHLFRGPPVLNQVALPHWSETCKDNLVMEHRPAPMAPTMPQIKLIGTEILRDQLQLAPISPLASPLSPAEIEESSSESLSQAGNLSPSQECYTLWKKIPGDAIVVTGSNKFVPQTLYKPFTEADKDRYLERASLSAPIIFMTKESLEWGISLQDVCKGKMQHLVDKDVPVLQDCGPSVSIRINWPGYPSYKRQISSRNWRRMKGPITMEKLAQNLAKTTDRFIEKMSNKPLEFGAERGWKVGPQHIKVEDLILVSLHHVSKGSWQPQFRLRRDVVL